MKEYIEKLLNDRNNEDLGGQMDDTIPLMIIVIVVE